MRRSVRDEVLSAVFWTSTGGSLHDAALRETAVGQYTLWCLNRVASWDRDRLARALGVRGLWASKHDVQLGSRARFDRNPGWEANGGTGVLMHEEHACDEYFVPLAVKCIGDPDGFLARLGDRMSADGRQRFEALRNDFARYFAFADRLGGEPPWHSYWEPFPMSNPLWKVGMFTRSDGPAPYAGLYEIVASEAQAHNRQAILVGYSQGGLVARFLAWMDEQLMDADRRAIAGVVLVQTPNHGSPLADTANADNVSAGLLGILTGLGGFPIVGTADPNTRAAIEAQVAGRATPGSPVWHFGVGAVCQILDAADRRHAGIAARAVRHLANGPQVADRSDGREGLHRVRRSRSGRARRSAHHPGAADGDAARADLSRRDCRRRHVARRSGPRREMRPGALAGAPPGGPALVRDGRGLLRAHRHGRGRRRRAEGELHKKIAALYQTGVQDRAAGIVLPPFAHDFVIPSVSQALYTLAPPRRATSSSATG